MCGLEDFCGRARSILPFALVTANTFGKGFRYRSIDILRYVLIWSHASDLMSSLSMVDIDESDSDGSAKDSSNVSASDAFSIIDYDVLSTIGYDASSAVM